MTAEVYGNRILGAFLQAPFSSFAYTFVYKVYKRNLKGCSQASISYRLIGKIMHKTAKKWTGFNGTKYFSNHP